jgi:hypothetical protein
MYAFWIHRQLDHSSDLVWATLKILLFEYDSEWAFALFDPF